MDDPLGQAADRLNEALDRVRDAFSEAFTGTRASIQLNDGSMLVYGKHGQQWDLYIEFPPNVDKDGTAVTEVQPLRCCSRALRVEAAQRIKELGATLAEQHRQQTSVIVETAVELERYADWILNSHHACKP